MMDQMASRRSALALVGELKGHSAWGAKVGVGSFVTVEFGSPVSRRSGHVHGRMHLWVYGAAWALSCSSGLLAGSQDEREIMSSAVGRLDGESVLAVVVDECDLIMTITLTRGLKFTIMPVESSDMEHWLLFCDDRVLTAGPGVDVLLEPVS